MKILWSEEHLKLAFYLYCQLPFGQLHRKNPQIIQLARLIQRTPNAVAMKLCNFASLDPAIVTRGRAGLSNVSNKDRAIWQQFHTDWNSLAEESTILLQALSKASNTTCEALLGDYSGDTQLVTVAQRRKQAFFRRAVLSSYQGRCCMSGIALPELLVASHIVPWSQDITNRLNPSNGLCLSVLHDKLFDRGFISLTDQLTVLISPQLKQASGAFVQQVILPSEGKAIEPPEKFMPSLSFLEWHRQHRFKG